MLVFSDVLYGTIELPEWMAPFLKLPEFVRLRGVRLSNVDSYQFKDFNAPTRWEHCVAVAHLALRSAAKRRLSERDSIHLALAALLHDVATPPFAHTAEYVLESFDHELESQRLLSGKSSSDVYPDLPVFASQLPQFHKACQRLSSRCAVSVDPDEVAQLVVGEGDLGFLIHGSVDLDNADNVTRACHYLGVDVDGDVPRQIAEWLAIQDHPPTDLGSLCEPFIQDWLRYRGELYGRFYSSSDEELGRQAYLQHLMRRAIDEGLSRRSLIWNTDERLLVAMEQLNGAANSNGRSSLAELVQRYRLLETAYKIAHVDIDSKETLRVVRLPQVARWIEREISTPALEAFTMVSSLRHRQASNGTLFPPPPGAILVFKLGYGVKREQLPKWLRDEIPETASGNALQPAISQAIGHKLNRWLNDKPWLSFNSSRRDDVVANLENVGTWDFRLSRNQSLHAYPSTFVHAIPATLIATLGVQGETVVDPFGGTGQTAVEAVKYRCMAISGDINSIACLAAKAKLTFLPMNTRKRLREMEVANVVSYEPANVPDFALRQRWFHDKTFDELCRIRRFIDVRQDHALRDFLLACFSSVLTSCTGRKGKQHGYFADNAPLPKGVSSPQYESAANLFHSKIRQNLNRLEQLYAFFEREARDPEEELKRVQIVNVDVTTAQPSDYSVEPESVAAIITSPPYLCMTDYCLGQRLSYQLLGTFQMEEEFRKEIGARRQRFRPEEALASYRQGIREFAVLVKRLLRKGGFLATVMGVPVAKSFQSIDILDEVDAIFAEHGLELLWSKWRPINWHRNHGYARLKEERVAVHVSS